MSPWTTSATAFVLLAVVWSASSEDSSNVKKFLMKLDEYTNLIQEQGRAIEDYKNIIEALNRTIKEQEQLIADHTTSAEAENTTSQEQEQDSAATEALNRTLLEQQAELEIIKADVQALIMEEGELRHPNNTQFTKQVFPHSRMTRCCEQCQRTVCFFYLS